ncbi:hypothetical protein M5689_013196 [Euphorbia peplus]|nr:hypothetical protein M5689_013196 [Euphorbia peplus]
MESDDEWITEMEEPCLLLDNSWMDMNECFEDNEGVGTSNKRKRGPRNLKRGRKENEHTLEEDEIEDWTLNNNEENEGEKELESVVVEEEDNSFNDFFDDEP